MSNVTVFDTIKALEEIPSYSKHEQFVQGIIHAIEAKIISKGDPLPSINVLIKELGFARETIMRGYRELKNRGIVEAKRRLGYFVANEATDQSLKVALLMFLFDSFQEQFYRNFRNELGNKVHIDVFFHHGNITMFETMIDMIKGKYGAYVIAPIPHPKTRMLLQGLPERKLVLFDRFEPVGLKSSYITQEFEQSTYRVLAELAPTIKTFDQLVFFHTTESFDPIEIIRSYRKFAKDFDVKAKIVPEYKKGSVKKGHVYFTLNNAEIWQILKDCETKGLSPGKDIGILSCNDELLKEIIGGGITTYSTDFSLMGIRAAQAVVQKETVHELIPTLLYRRKSL
ncbi:GntR family transcriptional regulator [Sphingobacterium sp. Mn56C]|uniref:GntR family transcriptional regulator n=1 Tax=Sphingobacterium sp. Mn56C TaxID=3395261 RepID=UPI003BC6725E